MTLALIALGVAMDATAVSAAYALRGIALRTTLTLAAVFGAAQALMAVLGATVGRAIEPYVARWDHWLALALLVVVGVHMIRESLEDDLEENPSPASLGVASIAALALATSIDSLAVGLTLPTIGLEIVSSSLIIGAVTAMLSLAGGLLGKRLGSRFGSRMGIVGGIVLIAIGIQIVIEHTTS